jgi:hypothetical protein
MELLAVGRAGKHVDDVIGVGRGIWARHDQILAGPHRRRSQVRIERLMRGVGRARGKPQMTETRCNGHSFGLIAVDLKRHPARGFWRILRGHLLHGLLVDRDHAQLGQHHRRRDAMTRGNGIAERFLRQDQVHPIAGPDWGGGIGNPIDADGQGMHPR